MASRLRLLINCLLLHLVSAWAPTPAQRVTQPVALVSAPPPRRAAALRLSFWPDEDTTNSAEGDDLCLLPIYYEDSHASTDDRTALIIYRWALGSFPLVFPTIAFLNYERTVEGFHELLEMLSFSTKTWYSVDGGQAEAVLIQPLINGVVQPSVSVILACLIASTLTSLRNRQVSIRASLNKEASCLRQLDATLAAGFAAPEDECERRQFAGMLRQYCTRLIVESREGSMLISNTHSSESELDGLIRSIYATRLNAGHERNVRELRMYETMTLAWLGMIQKLQQHRAQRLAELQTAYPPVHWAILGLLASSILFDFLIESDQAALLFLDSVRLRVLFSVIVGVISAAAALCIDLNDPFRGNFRITQSAEQLYVIRANLAMQEESVGVVTVSENEGAQRGVRRTP